MKNIYLLLFALIYSTIALAGDVNYSIQTIPKNLLEKANVIKRTEEIRFEVINVNKAKTYRKVAYTILNEQGDEFAAIEEMYDKLYTQPHIEATLYDGLGNKVKSLKRSDITDQSATDDNNLIDDNRIKRYNFYCKNYPYTIEYTVEQEQNHTMFYPRWIPVEKAGMAIENSTFTFVIPDDLHFRHKAFNYTDKPETITKNHKTEYTWKLQKFNAIQKEIFSPNWLEITPSVYCAPEEFAIQGYQGNMHSWQDFGKFVYALKTGKDALPENIKTIVHQLTDNIPDVKKKIEVLYDFMQKNTRYISVQLGIGGWQPFDATYVATKRYGDCKALTNYMFALLKEAGIPSLYTLVKAENKFFMPDFPSSQFNHAILCVPLQQDSVWLECTSQTDAAGYLGDFTGGHNVLLISETGGTLVKTPSYSLNENLQIRNVNAVVEENGNTSIKLTGTYKAIQQEYLHSLINYNTKEKQLEKLKTRFDLPQYDVVSFDYKEYKSEMPVVAETVAITAHNYASITGKRLFITPNILTKTSRKLSIDADRKYEIVLDYAYTDIDTVHIKIPEGYILESLPKEVILKSQFGSYSCSVKFEGSNLIYYRKIEQYNGRFPSSEYNELVKFYDQIYKADRNKVVMVK